MRDLQNGRTASRWNNTTPQIHIDAARDLLSMGGYTMDAIAHTLLAIAMVQQEELNSGR